VRANHLRVQWELISCQGKQVLIEMRGNLRSRRLMRLRQMGRARTALESTSLEFPEEGLEGVARLSSEEGLGGTRAFCIKVSS
jgi:hypothetical protein